jgi:hypothetical protein
MSTQQFDAVAREPLSHGCNYMEYTLLHLMMHVEMRCSLGRKRESQLNT